MEVAFSFGSHVVSMKHDRAFVWLLGMPSKHHHCFDMAHLMLCSSPRMQVA